MKNVSLWLALSNIEGMGLKTVNKLYSKFPDLSFENMFELLSIDKLYATIKNKNLSKKVLDKEKIFLELKKTKEVIENHLEKGIQVIDIASEYYPKLLRSIDDPPVALYCKGNIELLKDNKTVAIVGTRKPTEKGLRAAKKIATQFCKRDYLVVSGLALGIDTAGHVGALEEDGKTIAILAGSLDKIYPKENQDLANKIVNNAGLLISELPLGAKTFRNTFVRRDRIQSGLSLGICPVQAGIKSGTQHTIKFAQDQKRILFCPEPLEPVEVDVTQGIYYLLENNLAEKLSSESDYARIISLMEENYLKHFAVKAYENGNNKIKTNLVEEESKDTQLSFQDLIEDDSDMLQKKIEQLVDLTYELKKDPKEVIKEFYNLYDYRKISDV